MFGRDADFFFFPPMYSRIADAKIAIPELFFSLILYSGNPECSGATFTHVNGTCKHGWYERIGLKSLHVTSNVDGQKDEQMVNDQSAQWTWLITWSIYHSYGKKLDKNTKPPASKKKKKATLQSSGVSLTRKKSVFYAKKEQATQIWKCCAFTVRKKTVTSHIKMRLVFSFLQAAEKVCRALAMGINTLDFPRPLPSPSHPGEGMLVPTWRCSWHP